ncbi:MAG: hypothetical protein HLX51_00450 [Micrococcaceae bacterium]|nr:hypothetical protein [Micrococcaceae bacterium]
MSQNTASHQHLDDLLEIARHAIKHGFEIVRLGYLAYDSDDTAPDGWIMHLVTHERCHSQQGSTSAMIEASPDSLPYILSTGLTGRQDIMAWIDRQDTCHPSDFITLDEQIFDAVHRGWDVQRTLRPEHLFKGLRLDAEQSYEVSASNFFYNTTGHPSHRSTGAPVSRNYLFNTHEGELGDTAITNSAETVSTQHMMQRIGQTAPWFIGIAEPEEDL